MKRFIILPFIIFVFVLGGCATNKAVSGEIQRKAAEHGDVFREVADEAPMPGYSVLIIRASIKTVKEGFYPLESKSSLHGRQEYPFIFNIGGQGITWMAKGTPDIQQKTVDGKRNPEGGEGVKYLLEKKIALKPGTYKIFLGLTEEKVRKEIEVTLPEGKMGILQFTPVYFTGRYNRNVGSFYEGIRAFEALLDGKRIESNIAH